jgi:hypothetical protein
MSRVAEAFAALGAFELDTASKIALARSMQREVAAMTLDEKIAANRERIYQALRVADFGRYTRAIQSAEAVTLNHNLPAKVAVAIEAAVVLSVADALGIK